MSFTRLHHLLVIKWTKNLLNRANKPRIPQQPWQPFLLHSRRHASMSTIHTYQMSLLISVSIVHSNSLFLYNKQLIKRTSLKLQKFLKLLNIVFWHQIVKLILQISYCKNSQIVKLKQNFKLFYHSGLMCAIIWIGGFIYVITVATSINFHNLQKYLKFFKQRLSHYTHTVF